MDIEDVVESALNDLSELYYDIPAIKAKVEELANDVLQGDAELTYELLISCLHQVPNAVWAIINSPKAFRPVLDMILRYNRASQEPFTQSDFDSLDNLLTELEIFLEEGVEDKEEVLNYFPNIQIIDCDDYYEYDGLYIHFLENKLCLYNADQIFINEDSNSFNDLIAPFAITTQPYELELELSDESLYVFLKLDRYGLTSEQVNQINSQWS